jgi:hypothetical protein
MGILVRLREPEDTGPTVIGYRILPMQLMVLMKIHQHLRLSKEIK